MLILRRKVGEAFLVGDHISVTILGIESGGTVSIGIDAPRDVLILRSELQQAATVNQDSALELTSAQAVEALGSVFAQNKNKPEAPSGTPVPHSDS